MNDTDIEWDFFLAHAGADKQAAESLYDYLVEHSRVFLDSHCVLLGDDWDTKLAKAQGRSLMTIVLVSAHTERAYYQREEVAAAISFAREDPNSHRVVPIYIDTQSNDQCVPYGLRLKHGIVIDDNCSLADAARRLLDLKHVLGVEGATRPSDGSTISGRKKLTRRRERLVLLKWVARIPDDFEAYFRTLWAAGFGKKQIPAAEVDTLEKKVRALMGDSSRIIDKLPEAFEQTNPSPREKLCFAEVFPAFRRECASCFEASRNLMTGLCAPVEGGGSVQVPFSMLYSSLEVEQHLRILRMCAEELMNQFPVDDVEAARQNEPDDLNQ